MKDKIDERTVAINHGEVHLTQVKEIPANAKLMEVKGDTFKLADSETTGNHHLLEMGAGVELLEADNEIYVRNSKAAKVRCVIPARHDEIEVPIGTWKIGIAKEYDYLTQATRNVAD